MQLSFVLLHNFNLGRHNIARCGLSRHVPPAAMVRQQHRSEQMLHDNAKAQVSQILSYEDSPDQGVAITLRIAGPWADGVKSVVQKVDGQHVTYSYEPDTAHPEYRIPCTSFEKTPTDNSLPPHPMEQARIEDYVARNFLQCSYAPRGKEEGCHNTYHFDDVAFQRDRFD